MGETEYSEALKQGKKEYRARIAKGQFPYLPVLDEILSEADIQTEQNMGLVQVPLDFVVGTSTMGRTYSFAANFMPILDEETEFADGIGSEALWQYGQSDGYRKQRQTV